MRSLIVCLLLATAVDGVASDVGASNPKIDNRSDNSLTLAIADTGAGSRWAPQPFDNELARKAQVKEFEMFAEGLSDKIDRELNAIFSRKLQSILLATD